MTAKLRIKAGSVELELETEADLSVDDVKALLKEVETLTLTSGAETPGGGVDSAAANADGSPSKLAEPKKLHITSIAAKLDVKTGADLAVAAAAQLQLMDGKDSFTRQELLATMKQATKYYKASMSANLTSIISSLIPKKLNQLATDTYSLTADAHSALEAALA
jgi:hypothetical protein